jgi:beta-glucanase (GH16 family)
MTLKLKLLPFMKSLLFSLCLLGSLTRTTAQCYQLVWADEFNGTTLDASKWTQITGSDGSTAPDAELQYYTSSTNNTKVENGLLKIITRNDGFGGRAYTSGRMQSKNLGDWLYGKFEARIKLPVGQGMWPAFWMLPTDNTYGVWPQSGEIDIMETVGKEATRNTATIHTSYSGSGTVHSSPPTKYTLPTGTFGDDFHTFSMEWSPNLMTFYVDGNLYATKDNSTIAGYPWVFDKRFFILLNVAVGGLWAGAPDATTTWPQTMSVDYVRVYQKIQDVAVTGKTLVETNATAVSYAVPSIAGMTYQWSVTNGTLVSGQGSPQITVNWAKLNGTVSVVMNDGCAPASTASTPIAVTPNLWDNYGFEKNYVSWETRPLYNSRATFGTSLSEFTEGSKSAAVTTNTAGANPWDVQLSRANLNLLAGTEYILSFKAKSSVNQTVRSSFIRQSNFSTVAGQLINLTDVWQPFSLTFTPSSNENVMWNADLGTQPGTVYFDEFTFARTALIAMPIELRDFKGTPQYNGNFLTWTTANEVNNKGFQIERLMVDGEWLMLGFISAKGKATTYDYVDNQPFTTSYYRLRQIDNDGKETLSKVIAIDRRDAVHRVSVSPNPASNVLTVTFIQDITKDDKAITFDVFNVLGQIILRGPLNRPVDVAALPSGTYIVRVGLEQVKFVKQ